jgi:hypothetical protein
MGRTPRLELKAKLAPLLPKTWRVVDNARSIDSVPHTVVQIRLLEVSKLPQAPGARHLLSYRLTITAPGESNQAAENRLDDDLLTFLTALDAAHIRWDTASKVEVGDMRRIGYDITITATGNKKE